MNYDELNEYVNTLSSFSEPEIHAMTEDFFDYLGRPSEDKKIIHVAGTNGKGSVCKYINDILRAHGKKCGLFTSPHLVRINERIRIENEDVDDEAFAKAGEYVLDKMHEFGRGYKMNYFEFIFMMAMYIYSDSDVEYIILETGLGGRSDTTNLFKKPVLTIITHIDLDHTKVLGETIKKIAYEKAGIIKEGVPLIYADDNSDASEVIKKEALRLGSKQYAISSFNYDIVEHDRKNIDFCFTYDYYIFYIRLNTSARYQVANASLAIMAAITLLGNELKEEKLKDALGKCIWEGRMEEIAPDVYVDGAHNPDGISAFVKSVKDLKKITLIISVSRDKDIKAMLERLRELNNISKIIITAYEGGRSMECDTLQLMLLEAGFDNTVVCPDVKDAYQTGLYLKTDGALYIIGSLYLVGEIKQLMEACND